MYIEQFYIDIQVQYCGISDICGGSRIPWLYPLTHELTSRTSFKSCSDTLCMIDLIREKLTIYENLPLSIHYNLFLQDMNYLL